jgi:hypothetical protein
VRSNFVGVESWKLYSATHYGTKDLIETYIDEVEDCLKLIRSLDESSGISLDEKARFFKFLSKNFGTTTLALSGGGQYSCLLIPYILSSEQPYST